MSWENAEVIVTSEAGRDVPPPEVPVDAPPDAVDATPETPDAPPEPEPDAKPARARDEQGRFASATPAEGADEPEPPQSEDGDQSPESRAERRRKNDPNARIGQAVAKQRQAERDRDAAIQRTSALEQRLAALESALRGQPRPDSDQPAAGEPPPPAPVDLKPEDFETYEQYIAAVVEERTKRTLAHESAERARLEREAAQTRASQAMLAKHHERFEQAVQARPELEELTTADLQITPPMGDSIIAAEEGPDMAWHLYTHPEERERIAALPPGPALFEMGRLAERMRAATAAPAGSPAAPAPGSAPRPAPVSKAPAPIQPVGPSPNTNGVPLDKLPLSEYIRRVNQQELERRNAR